jgi:hypothetical protein
MTCESRGFYMPQLLDLDQQFVTARAEEQNSDSFKHNSRLNGANCKTHGAVPIICSF